MQPTVYTMPDSQESNTLLRHGMTTDEGQSAFSRPVAILVSGFLDAPLVIIIMPVFMTIGGDANTVQCSPASWTTTTTSMPYHAWGSTSSPNTCTRGGQSQFLNDSRNLASTWAACILWVAGPNEFFHRGWRATGLEILKKYHVRCSIRQEYQQYQVRI